MNKPVSTSCHEAPDLDGVWTRRAGIRHGGAGRWALAMLIGCVALLVAASAASAATGGISGKVTDTEFNPISGANVCLYDEAETLVECRTGITSASGEYTIAGLPEGYYRVGFSAAGFAEQYYRDVPYLFESTPVHVITSVVPNINAELEETGLGSVAGQVTNASTGQGASGVEVCSDEEGHCVETNGNGEYAISGLAAGFHSISFSSASACEEEQGEKIRCNPKSNLLSQSVGVKVKANRTETANAALQAGGQISGTVTSASITHPGIAKIEVCATKVTSTENEYGPGGCAYTNAGGQYTIDGLEGGAYKLEFNGFICSIPKKGERECPEVYVTQYAHGKQTHKQAETVPVTAGANTGGVNETLREAFPTTPVGAVAPTLTGTPVVGQALSCSQGSWAHEPTYLVYQWLRNGTVIAGQTGSTYTVQVADPGHSITCSVTAGNGAGAATATSNAVAIPVPLAVFAGAKVKGAVASVTLRCPGPGSCSGVMRLLARVTAKHGKRKKTSNVTIGAASFSMAAGKSVTLRVRLTGQGRKLVGKAGRRGLAVKIAGTGVKAQAAKLKPAPAKRRRR